MNSINVISINPAQSAKSALHPEVFERIAGEYRVNRDMTQINVSSKRAINFTFGINKGVGRKMSAVLFACRVLLGSGLVALGFISGISFTSFSPAIMMLGLGVSIFFGFFTRFLSFAAFGAFSYFGAMEFLNTGLVEWTLVAPAAIAFLFMVMGPGRFSIDQIMRMSLYRSAKQRARRKAIKLAENRLSYKAMQYFN